MEEEETKKDCNCSEENCSCDSECDCKDDPKCDCKECKSIKKIFKLA